MVDIFAQIGTEGAGIAGQVLTDLLSDEHAQAVCGGFMGEPWTHDLIGVHGAILLDEIEERTGQDTIISIGCGDKAAVASGVILAMECHSGDAGELIALVLLMGGGPF